MDIKFIAILAAVLLLGMWINRKYPSVLAMVPVIGS